MHQIIRLHAFFNRSVVTYVYPLGSDRVCLVQQFLHAQQDSTCLPEFRRINVPQFMRFKGWMGCQRCLTTGHAYLVHAVFVQGSESLRRIQLRHDQPL